LSCDDQEEAEQKLYLQRKRQERLRRRGLTEPVEYAAWKQVPEGLHTRKRWLRKNRRVAKGATPDAYLTRPSTIGEESEHHDHCSRFSLYSIEKTTPYTPTERTKACWDYSRLFLGHANRKTYVKKTYLKGDPDQQEPQWNTISDKGDLYFPYLGDKSARTHVNHTHIFGARADGGLTNYVIIDLDYHGNGRDVFLKMAEKLIDRFYGYRTWHLEVDLDDLQGIHFICTFEQPVLLDFAIQHLRDELSKLEKRNPDLVSEAHQLGKKSFAELELYPSTQQGIRLPLGRGRTLILDDYVKPIKRGKRQVGDVERYMRWIKDPNRKHKDRSEILDFLRICTPDEGSCTGTTSTEITTCSKEPRALRSDQPKWRKRFRQIRNDYFLDGNKNGIRLNTHLLVMARCCVAYGKTDEQIRVGLLSLLNSLPDKAIQASRRLREGKWPLIELQVKWAIKAAHDYRYQKDPVSSAAKWKQVAARLYHLGEDPLDKTTWKTSVTSNLSLFWTEKQRQAQYIQLAPVLCTTDSRVVFKFVDYVTQLVHRRQYRPLSVKYFKTCFTEHFPELSFTNSGKMSNLLAVLGTAGIVLRVRRGYSGLSSTYTLGRESLAAVSGAHIEPAATHEPDTTISFATLRRSWQGLRPRHIGKGDVSGHRRVSILLIPANKNHRVGRDTSICSHTIMGADQRELIARGPPSDP